MDNSMLMMLNDWTAFMMAFVANVTLLRLIQTRTPPMLRSYAQILGTHCMSDVFNCITMMLTGVVCMPVKERFYFVVSGYFPTHNDPTTIKWIIFCYLWIVVFTPICMVSLDFVARYILICHRMDLPLQGLIGFVICAYMSAAGSAGFISELLLRTRNFTEFETEDFKRVLGVTELPPMGLTIGTNVANTVFTGLCNVFICLEYVFIGYAVWMVHKTTSQGLVQDREQSKFRRTNFQITLILLVQAAIPLLICVPTFVNIMVCILNVEAPRIGQITCSFIPWLSVVRPVATILIVPHYRRAFSREKVTAVSAEGSSKVQSQYLTHSNGS